MRIDANIAAVRATSEGGDRLVLIKSGDVVVEVSGNVDSLARLLANIVAMHSNNCLAPTTSDLTRRDERAMIILGFMRPN